MSTENSGRNRGTVEHRVPHRIEPCELGNPGGRPKKLTITDCILAQLEQTVPASMKGKLPPFFTEVYGGDATFGQLLAFQLIAEAAKGNMKAMTIVLDRTEGKVSQNVALSGGKSEPITFELIRVGN